MITTADLDYYSVLRLSSHATSEEITKSYRILAQLLHPDKHLQASDAVRTRAAEEMKLLNEAYEVLGNPQRRAAYDATLATKPRIDTETMEAILHFEPWNEIDGPLWDGAPSERVYDRPKIALDTRVLSAGVVKQGTHVPLGLTIVNLGTGTLSGILRTDDDWLSIPKDFGGEHLKLSVSVDTSKLAYGRIHTATIVLSSNGGDETIAVLVGIKGGFLKAGVSQADYDLTLAKLYSNARMWDKAIPLLTTMTRPPGESLRLLLKARYAKGCELMDRAAFWHAAECFRQNLLSMPSSAQATIDHPFWQDSYMRLSYCHRSDARTFRAMRMFSRAASEMCVGMVFFQKVAREHVSAIPLPKESAPYLHVSTVEQDRAEWLASAVEGDCCWPTEARDASRSNWAPFILPKRQPLVLWTARVNDKIGGVCSSFDTLFLALDSGIVIALDMLTGSERWRCELTSKTQGTCTYVDGLLLLGANDKKLYCLDAQNGSIVWQFPTEGKVMSCPVVDSGIVYFTSGDKKCYAVALDGGYKIWDTKLGGWGQGAAIERAVSIVTEGSLLLATGVEVKRIDPSIGKVTWERAFANDLSVGSGGIRVCAHNGKILVLAVKRVQLDDKSYTAIGKFSCLNVGTGNPLWATALQTGL